MSDYSQITYFTPKDSLSTGNPNKIIYGSDVDAELSAISTAIATKADVDGDAIGAGTPATELSVDNLKLDANKIISTNTDGDIELEPNGTGTVVITNVDVAAGEIDGTAIGANSASTGAFTTLTASGDVNFDGGTFFVDASADAVGIGTTSPTANLSVGSTATSSGDIHLRTTKTAATITPSNTDAGGLDIGVGWVSGGQGPLTFSIGASEAARIDASGNLLCGSDGGGDIGSSTKRFKDLYLSSSVKFGSQDALTTDGTSNYLKSGSAIYFQPSNSTKMLLDASGNLLVGTTSAAGSPSLTARVTGGIFSTANGTTSVPNATWTTLATIPTGDGVYLVTAILPSSGDPANYNAVSIVTTSISATDLVDVKNAPIVDLRMSGSSLQVNQAQGTTQNINWSILRLA